MTLATGIGTAPTVRPVDTVVVKGLYNEAIEQTTEWQKATTVAPIVSMDAHEGEYPIDRTWSGLDLQSTPSALTPASLEGTEYEGLAISLDSNAFNCRRYLLGQMDLPDRRVAKLNLDNGIGLEDFVARRFAAKAASLHYQLVMSALDTAANYNGGAGSSSPFNLATSTTNDIIGQLEAAVDYFLTEQTYAEGDDLLVVVSRNLRPFLKQQDQIRDTISVGGITSPDFSTKGYATDAALEAWFRMYLPGSRLVFASGKYRDAAGNVRDAFGDATAGGNGTIAIVRAAGGLERSFLKTVVPSDESGGPLNIETERNAAFKGQTIFGDGYYDVHLADTRAGFQFNNCNT